MTPGATSDQRPHPECHNAEMALSSVVSESGTARQLDGTDKATTAPCNPINNSDTSSALVAPTILKVA